MRETPWQLWIDTGGTFTDCLGRSPRGDVLRLKVLSSSRLRGEVTEAKGSSVRLRLPVRGEGDLFAGYEVRGSTPDQVSRVVASEASELDTWLHLESPLEGPLEIVSPEEAPAFAARLLTGTGMRAELPPLTLRLATTKGTNALLERTGARVGLLVTEGFRDLLQIGDQARPDIFALEIVQPPPFHAEVQEVRERLRADGSVDTPVDPAAVRRQLEELREVGVEAIAVALLHSYLEPAHERVVGDLAREVGFGAVSLSSELASEIRVLDRARTAVVDAYLAPIVRRYLDGIARSMAAASGGSRMRVMTSAGGLVDQAHYRPKDSLLSGPAGGVVGAAAAGAEHGWRRLLTFDMGGTSTDVARIDGDHEYRYQQTVADARILAPALAIETVAAGGGSICWLDEGQLRVGPQSAGADPGPACYGRGGPLAITDVNLLLGRLVADGFEIPLDHGAALARAEELRNRVAGLPLEDMLHGLLDIANERMADAIRRVSVRRGFDPGDHTLLTFGGAGGQHACAVATLLGVSRILVPRDASLLSAFGLSVARLERFAGRDVLERLDACADHLPTLLDALGEEALEQLRGDLHDPAGGAVRRLSVTTRLEGQDQGLDLDWPGSAEELAASFRGRYFDVFGCDPPSRPLEIASVRAIASTEGGSGASLPSGAPDAAASVAARRTVRSSFDGAWQDVPRLEREHLTGRHLGPVLVVERHSVTVVEPGWSVEEAPAGGLVLLRA